VIDSSSGTFRVTIQLEQQDTLRPGQFVTVDLEVDRRRDVVVVPKNALVYEDGIPVVYRYVPEPEKGAEEAEDEDEAKSKTWYAGLAQMFGGGDEDADDDESAEATEEAFVAERVTVKLGLVDDDFAEVIEGVSEGDKVIVVGQSHLRDGARVRVNDSERDNAGAEPEGDSSEEKG
jgi:membrane fusion protein (multidrug efflux system)